MGSVHLALDPDLGREVALKMIPDHLSRNELFQERFSRECALLRTLDHPGIPRFFEEGSLEGQRYFTMESVDGSSLEAVLENRSKPEITALAGTVLHCVARILSFAHARGVIHRDISPRNILVTPSGEIKLIDFGIAKLIDDFTLTMTGEHIGTPAFIAPEQFDHAGAKGVDATADLWSLGVVGFRMLTGRLPFDGESHVTVIRQIINPNVEAPAVLDVLPDAPAHLSMVVDRLLQRSRARRFPSAQQLAATIENRDTPIAESYLHTAHYDLDAFVYLPHARRWAVVDEQGILKCDPKTTGQSTHLQYVTLIHPGGVISRRLAEWSGAPSPAAVQGPCVECRFVGANSPYCPSCGWIADGAGTFQTLRTRAGVQRRKDLTRRLTLAVLIGLGAVLVPIMGALVWHGLTLWTLDDPPPEAAVVRGEYKTSTLYRKVDGLKVDVNSAGFDDLVKIKHMSDARALYLLAYRHHRGAFQTTDDLRAIVSWTGQYNDILPSLTVGDTSAPAPPDKAFLARYRRVDINHATREDLMSVPFISENTADGIIEYRAAHGIIRTLEEAALAGSSRYSSQLKRKRLAWLDFISLGSAELDDAYQKDVNLYYGDLLKAALTIPDIRRIDLNHASLDDLNRGLRSSWDALAIQMHRHKFGAYRDVDEYIQKTRIERKIRTRAGRMEKMAEQILASLYVSPGDRLVTVDPEFLKEWANPIDLNSAPEAQIVRMPFLLKAEKEALLAARKSRRLKRVDDIRPIMAQDDHGTRRYEILKDFVAVK